MENKFLKLKEMLKQMGSVAIAFSGGVDSTFLLKVAHDVLKDKVIAYTIHAGLVPEKDFREAKDFTFRHNINHTIIDTDGSKIPFFAQNPVDRCYHCKKHNFELIIDQANQVGITKVLDGSNADDDKDYRPGKKAIRELGVLSPLAAVGMTKEEIRQHSRQLGLDTWEKPAYACLASRFPYGEEITDQAMRMVDLAEEYLRELGFGQVRVRVHGKELARIEVEKSRIAKFFDTELMGKVHEKLMGYGFTYVSLDLKGYEMGSLNRSIKNNEKQD